MIRLDLIVNMRETSLFSLNSKVLAMLHQKRLLTRRSCTLPVSLFKFSTTSTSSSVLHQQQLSSSPSSQSRRVFENLSGLSAKELQQKLSPKDRILPSSSPSSTNNSTTHILYKKEETVAKVFAASPSYANAFLATIAKKPEVQAAYE